MGKLRHREASESQDLNPVGLAPEAAVWTARLNYSSLEILPAYSCHTNTSVSKLEKNVSLYIQFKIFKKVITPCHYRLQYLLACRYSQRTEGKSFLSSEESEHTCLILLLTGIASRSCPPQCACLEKPMNGGAWWAAVYGVAQSWTQLKRLSSSSMSLRALAEATGKNLSVLVPTVKSVWMASESRMFRSSEYPTDDRGLKTW